MPCTMSLLTRTVTPCTRTRTHRTWNRLWTRSSHRPWVTRTPRFPHRRGQKCLHSTRPRSPVSPTFSVSHTFSGVTHVPRFRNSDALHRVPPGTAAVRSVQGTPWEDGALGSPPRRGAYPRFGQRRPAGRPWTTRTCVWAATVGTLWEARVRPGTGCVVGVIPMHPPPRPRGTWTGTYGNTQQGWGTRALLEAERTETEQIVTTERAELRDTCAVPAQMSPLGMVPGGQDSGTGLCQVVGKVSSCWEALRVVLRHRCPQPPCRGQGQVSPLGHGEDGK